MPMDFPDMDSLKRRAEQRKFRQPHEGEDEATYRKAFADFMVNVDPVESSEIRNSVGWDKWDEGQQLGCLLDAMTRNSKSG